MKNKIITSTLASVILMLTCITVTTVAHAQERKQDINASELFEKVSPLLVDNKGEPVVDGKAVMEKPYVLFYWSAHWCGPCRKFTPQLVEFYNTHGGGEKFEVILVSSDRSEEAMKDYMIKEKMPWYAIDYTKKKNAGLKKFCGRGIPNIMLIDRKGNQLARGRATVITKMKELLKK
ncbi:MAG: thiol-disulfide isomerase/thioredoxin [Cryomorphaceae bacterium]|jgi:thiol-disulfide isomerase/thioredoxin